VRERAGLPSTDRIDQTGPVTQTNDPRLQSFINSLARADEETRTDRARRLIEVYNALPEADEHPFGRFAVLGASSAGPESHILMENAVACYRDGHYAAALVCGHALCEQELAGRLHHTMGSSAPRGWERWGLGQLLQHAVSEQWFSPRSNALLADVNRKRRSFYHYRAIWDENTVVTRTIAKGDLHFKEDADDKMRETLREDALQAIRAAFIVRHE
jgi:hypothetical protein